MIIASTYPNHSSLLDFHVSLLWKPPCFRDTQKCNLFEATGQHWELNPDEAFFFYFWFIITTYILLTYLTYLSTTHPKKTKNYIYTRLQHWTLSSSYYPRATVHGYTFVLSARFVRTFFFSNTSLVSRHLHNAKSRLLSVAPILQLTFCLSLAYLRLSSLLSPIPLYLYRTAYT